MVRLGLAQIRLAPVAPRLGAQLGSRPGRDSGAAGRNTDLAARLPWIVPRSEALPSTLGLHLPSTGELWTRHAQARVTSGAPSSFDPLGFLPAAPPSRRFDDGWTDLGLRVVGRSELGGEWNRFQPCTDQFEAGCNPTLLPQLRPDLNLAVQLQGTLADRVKVDVDYDQLREFGGDNRLSIAYEGAPDDILRRVEVGDVTFALPRSRFLTDGIPAGNFGFQAEGQLGPVAFRGVWAEQRGDLSNREFRLTGVGGQRRFAQSDTVVLDDADYVDGQFFFVVDPREVSGFPHVDVLQLDASAASPRVVPGIEPVQLYRFETSPTLQRQVEGYIQADATAEGIGGRVVESGWFRYLQPGRDYFVHPSGLWVALRNPLNRDEMLAATYITATGDTIGTYNPELAFAAGRRPQLRLLKASAPNHQPGRPTWEMEMHQVYRVSASPDVDPTQVEVTLSLGELSAGRTFKRAPDGRDISFLQLLGLDAESPLDRIDPAYIFSTSRDLDLGSGGVQGTFVVFPTLFPFAQPPPNPTLDLSDREAAELLGSNANRRIYEAEDPFERNDGGLFRLTIPFQVRSEGVISSFSLGALGVLDGSERIRLGDRVLTRGVDYEIDYDLGQVTLLDPEALFATTPDAVVRASWEQQQVFRTAPTSVFGFNATFGDERRGTLDLLTLYRTERTLVSRPTLGLEPEASLTSGLNGRLQRDLPWADGLLAQIPGLRTGQASQFEVDGELALSVPNPNTQGAVFVDDFDATDDRPLSLRGPDWVLGSAPIERDGAETVLPQQLDASTQGRLTWQHQWIVESATGDSLGVHQGFLPREEVDRQIRVAGSRVREPGLRLQLTPRSPDGGASWGSITTLLSPTGTDLTQSEFLEFYVAGDDDLSLVVDLGLVSEDALFVDDNRRTSGIKPTGVPWGIGVLDQEADPARGDVWGNAADLIGVWGESCESEPGRIFRLGDRRANCTRNNGRNDTEDLDGDGNLDTIERTLRFTIRLDGSSPFLARTRNETGTDFRLYRIPLRSSAATQVNGPFTEADLRAVRHLRFTVAGGGVLARNRASGLGDLTIARLRIRGSRWLKRGIAGAVRGLVGDTAAVLGAVEVGPVSRITDGDAYTSPPGVLEQLFDPTSAVGGQGVEFNEKSLRIIARDIEPGDRGEAYFRFPQRPRNFLRYRQARLWVVPKEGPWGPDEPVDFFVKIGHDPENFYLYRTPLRPAVGPGTVVPEDWLPEVRIDFDVFQELRTLAEERIAFDPPRPGDGPVVVWARDSTYAIVVSDRGRAPNLAAVRELALGIWNRSEASFDGEVWVDELRLGDGLRRGGLAAAMNARLALGDVIDTRVGFSSRGAFYRQLDEEASFQTDQVLDIRSEARLERFVPSSWGVEMPVRVQLEDVRQQPTFLPGSDVRADLLAQLRDVGNARRRLSLGLRKVAPARDPLMGLLVNGFEADVAWYDNRTSTITGRVEAEGLDARVGIQRRPEIRDFSLVPSILKPLVQALLPEALEQRLLDARLRWSPESLEMSTSYTRQDADIYRFESILQSAADSAVRPLTAPREMLETVADLSLRPLSSLTADLTFISTRDLLAPDEAVTNVDLQGLLAAERTRVAGIDLGWETTRNLRTRVAWRPSSVSWLRHEVAVSTRYGDARNPSFVRRWVPLDGSSPLDTLLALERNARAERELTGLLSLDIAALGRALGDVHLLSLLKPVTFTSTDGLFSRFDRDPVDPGLGYQFGWGGRSDFLLQRGDTAAALTDREVRRVRAGLALERIDLDVSWGRTRVGNLDVRADRTLSTDVWPDLRISIDGLDPGRAAAGVLRRVTLSGGVRRSTSELVFGALAQRRTLDEWTLPIDLTLGWQRGLTTSYRSSTNTGRGRDPTGDTERDRITHRVSVTSAFLPPFGLGAQGGQPAQPVRLSLIGSYVAERECRVPAARPDCVPFIDELNRALAVTLDTRVGNLEVGFQGSYSDRRSFIGQRRGATLLQVGLFGRFLIEAGALSQLTGRGLGGGFPGGAGSPGF